MFSSASGEYPWKYSPFWWDLLLYKLQKLRGISNIRAACGHWTGALVYQELSRKPGDLLSWFEASWPDGSLTHHLQCIATANYLNFLWVCNQGNGTCGHWWGWLCCFTHGFSCLWWYYVNGCLWLNDTIPVLLGDWKCLLCSWNQSWNFSSTDVCFTHAWLLLDGYWVQVHEYLFSCTVLWGQYRKKYVCVLRKNTAFHRSALSRRGDLCLFSDGYLFLLWGDVWTRMSTKCRSRGILGVVEFSCPSWNRTIRLGHPWWMSPSLLSLFF